MQTLMKLVEFFVLFGACIAAGWYVRRLFSGQTMAAREAKRRLDAGEDMLMLDVRTPDEFTGDLGHVAGSLNVPLDELDRRLGEAAGALDSYRAMPIVVVCRSGSRAHAAARMLRRRGLRDVHVLAGGMIAWNAARLPVARDAI